jgi:hypothetical protein
MDEGRGASPRRRLDVGCQHAADHVGDLPELHGQTCVFDRFDKPNCDGGTILDFKSALTQLGMTSMAPSRKQYHPQ